MASLNPNTAVLGRKNARHLLRRATFKYTKALIDQYALLTPQAALNLLVANEPLTVDLPYDPTPPNNPPGNWTLMLDQTAINGDYTNKNVMVAGWWLYNALHSATLKFKLTHFLSTRFTVSHATVLTASAFYDHVRLLQFYAYGNYKELSKKMTLDNAMLNYLDNDSNLKNSPNENYAREFLELFTIGKGPQIGPSDYTTYTEADVVQAARLLTGFRRKINRQNIDPTTSLPKGFNDFFFHHLSPKTFSSAFQNTVIPAATNAAGMDVELSTFVDMIFNQLATAKNIVRKMYIYFVKANITTEVETDIITPLATELKNNGYEMLPIVRKLLESKHFYDLDDANALDENIGAIIKSPLQQLTEICGYFQVQLPDIVNGTQNDKLRYYEDFYRKFVLEKYMAQSNMKLFEPANVAGHLAYYQSPEYDKSWITSSTIIARYRIGDSLLHNQNRIVNGNTTPIYAQIKISLVIKDGGLVTNPSDAVVLVTQLCNNLFAQTPDAARVAYFMNSFLLQGLDASYWLQAWTDYISTNNNSVVEPRLQELVKNILRAPESQIF